MDANGCPLGVILEYFPIFIRKYDISFTATTEQICREIIKKETIEDDCCFYDLIPDEFKAPAQVFVSHAWSQPFKRISDLLLSGRLTSGYNMNISV